MKLFAQTFTGLIIGLLVGFLTFVLFADRATAAITNLTAKALSHTCDEIKQKALKECANAFEASYYYGGGSGRDDEFRRLKDSTHCQTMGSNLYWFCVKPEAE